MPMCDVCLERKAPYDFIAETSTGKEKHIKLCRRCYDLAFDLEEELAGTPTLKEITDRYLQIY